MTDKLVHHSTRPSQHNILISIPRTASNLLTHLLALPSQPGITTHPRDGYFFLPALVHRLKNGTFQRPHGTWSELEKQEMNTTLHTGVSALEAWISSADAQSLGTYVKEHVNWTLLPSIESHFLHPGPPSSAPALHNCSEPANPTAIPDAFWRTARATLLIRHPALTFPSALRTAIDNEGTDIVLGPETETTMRWECTFHWHTLLYEFLVAQRQRDNDDTGSDEVKDITAPPDPLIIDASQLKDPSFVRHYAAAVGLDAGLVRTEWSATSADEQSRLGKTERRMKDTLLDSTGIVKGKLDATVVDVGEEREKWEAEFGGVLAARLEGLVGDALAEYEWLFERRWRG